MDSSDTSRPRHVFRDYGLMLALLLAAAVVYWRTTLPALERNRKLDQRQIEMLDQESKLRDDVQKWKALTDGRNDAETIERVSREQHGAMGLPKNEKPEEPAPASASGQ